MQQYLFPQWNVFLPLVSRSPLRWKVKTAENFKHTTTRKSFSLRNHFHFPPNILLKAIPINFFRTEAWVSKQKINACQAKKKTLMTTLIKCSHGLFSENAVPITGQEKRYRTQAKPIEMGENLVHFFPCVIHLWIIRNSITLGSKWQNIKNGPMGVTRAVGRSWGRGRAGKMIWARGIFSVLTPFLLLMPVSSVLPFIALSCINNWKIHHNQKNQNKEKREALAFLHFCCFLSEYRERSWVRWWAAWTKAGGYWQFI